MLSNSAELVLISSIVVNRAERQRELIETEDLEKSISKRGLLQPIIVSRDLVLKAGERRLTACKNLGHQSILVRWAESLSPVEAQIIELEENIKRSDLEWKDCVRAIARIHGLYRELDPDWTMSETAEECALTLGTISMYLRVHAELGEQRVHEAGTVREAYNTIARRDQRAQGDALEELMSVPDTRPIEGLQAPIIVGIDLARPGSERTVYAENGLRIVEKPATLPPFSGILNTSFLDWAPQYQGPKFNLVHCDFPYGVDLFDGPQGRGAEPSAGYKDTRDLYFTLLESFCKNLDRFMSISAHLMFWYSAKHHEATVAMFRDLAPSLAFTHFPLIWVKSDNAGIASDPTHGPRHVYETCLLASRSKRQIIRVKADAYSAPTDKKLHPSTKPRPMLEHFFEMLVDENTSMFDPTCGSGASLRAAENLGAKHVLGLELDKDFAQVAQKELANSRLLRGASRKVEGI